MYLNDVSMQDSLVTYIKGLTGVRAYAADAFHEIFDGVV